MISKTATTVTQANGAEYLRVSGTHLTLVYAPTAALAKQFATAPASRGRDRDGGAMTRRLRVIHTTAARSVPRKPAVIQSKHILPYR
jgi:hypothetical protein